MDEPRWIRASEVQAFGYCARSWWLHFVRKLEPEDYGQLGAGTARHQALGRRVARGEGVRQAALALLLLGLVLAVIAGVRLLGGG